MCLVMERVHLESQEAHDNRMLIVTMIIVDCNERYYRIRRRENPALGV